MQFTSKPPSLEAHLLPLQMQGTLSLNAPTGSTPAEITALAWDATSSHLALILGGCATFAQFGSSGVCDILCNVLPASGKIFPCNFKTKLRCVIQKCFLVPISNL